MTTGKFKCYICKKLKSCKQESTLKRDTGIKNEVTKNLIYEYACMDCFKKLKGGLIK